MVAIMEKVRKQLLAQERQQKLHARWSTFKPVLEDLSEREAAKRSMMGFGDIALLPEVRAIMGAPPDVDVKPSDFDELREQFDEIIGRWSVRLRDELRTVSFGSDTATQGSSKDSGTGVAHASDVEPLELATTRFRCKRCMDRGRETMSYPAVLFHLCAQVRMASWPPKTGDEYEMVAVDMLSRWFSTSRVVRRCWRGVLKSIPPTAMTCKLLELCGKDPRTATVVEMDAEDVKFVLDGKTTMSWRAAVRRIVGSVICIADEIWRRCNTRTGMMSFAAGRWQLQVKPPRLRDASSENRLVSRSQRDIAVRGSGCI